MIVHQRQLLQTNERMRFAQVNMNTSPLNATHITVCSREFQSCYSHRSVINFTGGDALPKMRPFLNIVRIHNHSVPTASLQSKLVERKIKIQNEMHEQKLIASGV